MRWAICSNTTITPVARILSSKLQEAGEISEFFVTQYGEAVQQILQPGSPLYDAHPDWVVLYLDLEQLRPGVDGELAFATPGERIDVQRSIMAEVLELVRALRANCVATILVNSFPVVPRTALGIGPSDEKHLSCDKDRRHVAPGLLKVLLKAADVRVFLKAFRIKGSDNLFAHLFHVVCGLQWRTSKPTATCNHCYGPATSPLLSGAIAFSS